MAAVGVAFDVRGDVYCIDDVLRGIKPVLVDAGPQDQCHDSSDRGEAFRKVGHGNPAGMRRK